MKSKACLLLVLGIIISPSSSFAVIAITSRYNDYLLSFPNMDFGSATCTGNVFQKVQGDTIGETGLASLDVPANLSGVSWTGDSNIQVSNIVAGLGILTALLTTTTAEAETHAVFGGTVSGGLGNFVGTGVVNGRNALEFHAESPGGVSDGSPYLFLVEIPGDWSAAGTGMGQHELLIVNSAWSIIDNFQYFSAIDTTLFFAVNNDYQNNGTEDIDLSFRLNGSSVPEPASFAALAVGGLALLRRRRKAQ